jgi:calcineurin-like phosphoesterase family protein
MKILLNKGQKVWFTSDTHYNHANICRGTTQWDRSGENHFRDFDTLNQMNAVLVNNINAVVGQDDILIHLGDWSFGGFDSIAEFRNRIVCQNIHLVLGNHDHHISNNRDGIAEIFSSVHQYLDLSIKWPDGSGKHAGLHFVCMHYPIASWDGLGKGVPHLHGHVHLPPNRRVGRGKVMDVGVDGNNLSPISMSDVVRILEKQPIDGFLDKDHHTITENYKNKL